MSDLFYDLRSWVINQIAYSGSPDARQRTDALIDAARDGYVRYEPGSPLILDGVDCSPENVRSLEHLVQELKAIVYQERDDES